MSAEPLPSAYVRMLAEDRHHVPEAFVATADQLFDGVPLVNKRVLEIGSGKGLLSIYLALRGASVTSLEPELAGSTSGVLDTQQARCRELGLSVECINADFNEWTTDRMFDVVVAANTINHLYPSERHAYWHRPTWDGNVATLRRVKARLTPGGVFVATDASRYSFFLLLRKWVRPPWTSKRGVNWRHHQNAATWAALLHAAGFAGVERDYYTPSRLRPVSWLVRNGLASFWLRGVFIVRART
jgi:SAM-dependent methyltransferase